jgi:riboflavin synthase
MFSGIVEQTSHVIEAFDQKDQFKVIIERPNFFDDLALGDSVCVDGVCLTVEAFDVKTMQFAIGAETKKITGWVATELKGKSVNLERSLKFSSRIHGHLVTGHVETVGRVQRLQKINDSLVVVVETNTAFLEKVLTKGCVTVNGVSLTVNEKTEITFSVCLVPETQLRTNLTALQVGDSVNLESDYFTKIVFELIQQKGFGLNERK